MKIKSVGNKIIAKIEIIAGVILAAIGIVIMFDKWVENLSIQVISFLVRRPPNLQWPGRIHLIGEGILAVGTVGIGLFILPYWDRLKQNKTALQLVLQWDRLKQNKVIQIIAPIGATIFIWILITAKEFWFAFMGNEADYLPSVKQVVDHAWLPNDWYLNLNIGYRQAFDFIFGELVSRLGFVNGAYAGRLIVYCLAAIAIYVLFRTLHLRPYLGILVLLIFLNQQSLVAGEFIVGGLEPKIVAYSMVMLSFAFFLRKRYFTGFALAGAALSFHVLVGGYALFCILVASLLNKSWRSEWRLYIKNCWPFLITGFFGLWAIFDQLLPQPGIDQNQAWNIYVQLRVPQHTLPSVWNGHLWMAELALATGFFIIMYFRSTSSANRFIAAIAIGSVSLFLVGLVIYALGEIPLLRFYWFRFPDVMVPFLGMVLIALLLNGYAEKRITTNSLFQRMQRGLQTILRLLPPVVLIFLIIMLVQQTDRLQTSYEDSLHITPGTIRPAFDWISANTPQQAQFLVDPSELYFYIYAQRAMLVSWKHSPQSAAAILEWYERLKACNGNVDLADGKGSDPSEEIHTNFYKLDEAQIQNIANLYGINYYVGLADQKLSFERVYSDAVYAVYKIK